MEEHRERSVVGLTENEIVIEASLGLNMKLGGVVYIGMALRASVDDKEEVGGSDGGGSIGVKMSKKK